MTVVQWKNIFEAAASGDENAIRHFIEVQGVPIDIVTDEKQTLAHIAAENTHLNVLKYVLGKEPSLLTRRDNYNNTILYHAVERGFLPMVKYLVDELGADIYESINPGIGNNAIHVAAEEGRVDILKYFIEDKKADVDTRNEAGEPTLFVAAAYQRMPVFKYLVEKGNATVTLTDHSNNTILDVCAKTGDLIIPRYLLDTRKIHFDINRGNEIGRTVVYLTSGNNHLALLKYFVEEKHADVNKCDDYGRTPLHSAASNSNLRIAKFLIKHGADPQARDMFGRTAKDASTNPNMTQYLDEEMYKHATRNRRSASWSSANIANSITLLRPVVPHLQIEDLSRSSSRSASLADVNALLLFTVACMSYVKKFRYRQPEYHNLVSLPEILRNRIEPLALDAINSERVSENS